MFSFLEQFFSSSIVVAVAKANLLQTPAIAVFARNWSRADPNFAPFRWRTWLAVSEFLCFLTNQNASFVTSFLHSITFFLHRVTKKLRTFLLANHNREIFSCILLCLLKRVLLCKKATTNPHALRQKWEKVVENNQPVNSPLVFHFRKPTTQATK